MLLWSNPEHELIDGTILKVHIKSNISQVYVVSIPGSKEKFEIPLWQATPPQNKGKALKQQKRFSEFEHTYASVKLDGLPIRADSVNTAKQVYRLREGEVIRCLYKGSGAAVTNGRGNMSGEWLRVLTEGGTFGWCFSHNLELFKSEEYDVLASKNKSTGSMDELKGESDKNISSIKNLVAKRWYPESFRDLISVGRIDINQLNPSYGFSFGLKFEDDKEPLLAGTAVLKNQNKQLSWTYTDIEKKADKEYEFTGTKLKMTIRGSSSDTMILQYTENGRLKQETLVALSEDIDLLIKNEIARRQKELKRIFAAGPEFKSSNYGTIKFTSATSANWNNFKLLVPSIISSKAKSSVTLSLDYFISNSLKSSYDGVLTMRFAGMDKEVNFLYKLTDTGLRLEDASKAPVKDGVVSARSSSPMVLFFEKK